MEPLGRIDQSVRSKMIRDRRSRDWKIWNRANGNSGGWRIPRPFTEALITKARRLR